MSILATCDSEMNMPRTLLTLVLLVACASPPPSDSSPDTADACEGECPCEGDLCPIECVTPECRPECNSAGLCEVACNDAELCEVDCNSVETCRVYCEDAASCEVSCNSVASCEVECPFPGQCNISCNSSDCSCVGPGCP